MRINPVKRERQDEAEKRKRVIIPRRFHPMKRSFGLQGDLRNLQKFSSVNIKKINKISDSVSVKIISISRWRFLCSAIRESETQSGSFL